MGEVLSLEAAVAWRARERDAGHTVVLTNGLFDLLHVGHVRSLRAARALGDALIVGLNSDASAAALKPGRPLIAQEERAELLAALSAVDAVVIFDTPDALDLVRSLRPDVYTKGGDYGPGTGKQPPEAAIVEAHGGKVVYLPFVSDHSTTLLLQRILREFPDASGAA